MKFNYDNFFIGEFRNNILYINRKVLYPNYLNLQNYFYDIIISSLNHKKIQTKLNISSYKGYIPENEITMNAIVYYDSNNSNEITIVINWHDNTVKGTLTLKKSVVKLFNGEVTIPYDNINIPQNTDYTLHLSFDTYITENNDKIKLYFDYKYHYLLTDENAETYIYIFSNIFNVEQINSTLLFNHLNDTITELVSNVKYKTMLFYPPVTDYINTNLYITNLNLLKNNIISYYKSIHPIFSQPKYDNIYTEFTYTNIKTNNINLVSFVQSLEPT